MNAEQLNAIKERAAKATPGPWEAKGLHSLSYARVEKRETKYESKIIVEALNDDNIVFIAHAREDVPALVAEVERLQQETEYLKRSLLYIAERRESNRDWTAAHNALAVYGRPKGAY